ncbi:hypothetical protein [Blattabacterium cuenoti]|uniref:hypothetical protein n=1 Tax=Blattabacterium cuenoti TaxID=1653831 RepID=UPI00163D2B25|nr:hypothetical protein [Blattabacterium cuenoti]
MDPYLIRKNQVINSPSDGMFVIWGSVKKYDHFTIYYDNRKYNHTIYNCIIEVYVNNVLNSKTYIKKYINEDNKISQLNLKRDFFLKITVKQDDKLYLKFVYPDHIQYKLDDVQIYFHTNK